MWTADPVSRGACKFIGPLRIPHGELPAFVHGHREYELSSGLEGGRWDRACAMHYARTLEQLKRIMEARLEEAKHRWSQIKPAVSGESIWRAVLRAFARTGMNNSIDSGRQAICRWPTQLPWTRRTHLFAALNTSGINIVRRQIDITASDAPVIHLSTVNAENRNGDKADLIPLP